MKNIIKSTLLLVLICVTIHCVAETGTIITKKWTVDNIERQAIIYIPANATSQSTPVLFDFHGHGGNMQNEFDAHHFEKLWPEAIIIVPQGLKTPGQLVDRAGNYSGWQSGPGTEGDRDLHFFDTMTQYLIRNYTINQKQIFATGHSNGGSFTYQLWAVRGNILAAIAPSAALIGKYTQMVQPKPVMQIMGDSDPLVKPTWQKMTSKFLLRLNNCTTNGNNIGKYATLYPSTTNTPVLIYEHPGGHIYPKEANAVVVDFFKKVVNWK